MNSIEPLNLLKASDAEIKQNFESFIAHERDKGLIDIKFAISNQQDSTVLDAMRQMMIIQSMSDAGQLEAFND